MDPIPDTGRFRLVGRQSELAALRSELNAAAGGDGRLVLLVGEPGIGKTHTATVLADEARQARVAVAWGRCHPNDVAPAYWPWIQALRTLAAERADAAGDLPAILDLLQADSVAAAEPATPERARFEVFGRVAAALEAVSRTGPLLMVFDDLQWADGDSLRLLEFVARELGTWALLILATVRTLVPESGPVDPRLAAIARAGRRVPLAGLARAAVREMLVERLDDEPDAATVERVRHITGGNPFFVIEVAHLLASDPSLSGQVVPPVAQAVLRERLAPLSSATLRLLQAAAVSGLEFDLDSLSAVVAEPVDALWTRLEEPLRLGLIHALPGTLRRHAFTHALLRESLLADLSPADRSALHLALARALEAAGAADDDRLPRLAHHFFEAARTSDPADAIRYGCEAGERAQRSLAYDESIRCFERVLAALRLASDDRARWRAQSGLAESLYGAGEALRAEGAFREAIDLARPLGSETLATTALRWALARTEVGVPSRELNGLLEEALDRLPPGPSVLRARLMARLAAGLHVQPGSEARRRGLADAAIAMAAALDDRETLGFVRAHALIGLLGPDDLSQRLAATHEILQGLGAEGPAGLDALLLRLGDLAESGDRGGVDQVLAALEQRSRTTSRPFLAWSTTVARAGAALIEGRFEAAERLIEEGFALGKRVEPQAAVLRLVQQRYPLRGWQGRIDEVIPAIEHAVAAIAIPAWRAALAFAYDIAHRRDEARAEFDALAADGFAALPRDATWLSGMLLLASLCGRLADIPRARILYGRLLPYHDRIAVNRPLVIAVGPVASALGVLAGQLGEWSAAEAHFAQALSLSERMGARPWQAEIRFHWACMLDARDDGEDRARAARLLGKAESTASALGMTLLTEWIGEGRDRPRPAANGITRRAAAGEDGLGRPGRDETALSGRGPTSGSATGRLRRDGEVWTLEFAGRTTRLRHMVGLAHLRELLARPARELHVSDLVGRAQAGQREPGLDAATRIGDAGEQLDARARADYAARLRDAREELERAERHADQGRRERLCEEIEFLTAELTRGRGLGGRARRAGSSQERARISVSRAIKYAIDKISPHDPDLADHLRRSIRTGAYCVYSPASRDGVDWTFE